MPIFSQKRSRIRRRIQVLAAMPLIIAVYISGRPCPGAVSISPAQNALAEPEALTKARAYCRRLQFASLDFVCREDIAETITGDGPPPEPIGNTSLNSYQTKTNIVKHHLTYDYQYVRSGSLTKEKRILLEEDGVRKNVPDSDLGTWSFHYANVLFGPATLLDERNVGRYDFEVQGTAELWGERAVIIQARPRAGAGDQTVPFGRMWVADRDGAVLKIEWDQHTLGNKSALEERTKTTKGEPRLTMTSEFGFVQKGVRFPSRHTIIEAYAQGNKAPVVRSQLVVDYGQYQFFTVETQVDFEKNPDGR